MTPKDIERLRYLSILAQVGEAREPYSDELAFFLSQFEHEVLFELVEIAYRHRKDRR